MKPLTSKGAIRSTLSAVATTAQSLDLAMSIVYANLELTLEEELFEIELKRHELAQKRLELEAAIPII